MATRFPTGSLDVPNVDISSLLNAANLQREKAFAGAGSLVSSYFDRQENRAKKEQDDAMARLQGELFANISNPNAIAEAIETGQFGGADFSKLTAANQNQVRNMFLTGLQNAQNYQANRQQYADQQRELQARPIMERLTQLAAQGDTGAALQAAQAYGDAGYLPNAAKTLLEFQALQRTQTEQAEKDKLVADTKAGQKAIFDAVLGRQQTAEQNKALVKEMESRGMIVPKLADGSPDFSQIAPLVRGSLTELPTDTNLFGQLQRELFAKNPQAAVALEPILKQAVSRAAPSPVGQEAEAIANNQASIDAMANLANAAKQRESVILSDAGLQGGYANSPEGIDLIQNTLKGIGLTPQATGDLGDQYSNVMDVVNKYAQKNVPAAVIAQYIQSVAPERPLFGSKSWFKWDSDRAKNLDDALKKYTNNTQLKAQHRAILDQAKNERLTEEQRLYESLFQTGGRFAPATRK